MLIIGLMSGTSLDGCDAALVEITKDEKFILKDFVTLPYNENFKEKIKRNLSDATAKLSEICSLNFELGYIFKDTIDLLLEKAELQYKDIDYVASHGQTIWHSPHNKDGISSTLQIGEAQVISVLTGIPVISNFRSADVICGGEGAPLVPRFEQMFFKDEENIILQNIGGMGNLTYINSSDVVAFDTGPGNVMIDFFMNKYYNLPFDKNGEKAFSGKIIHTLLDSLMNDEFIKRKPPKSTGREKYSKEALEVLSKSLDIYQHNDVITTITEYTVQTILYQYKNFIKDYQKVIVSGGGVHNDYIMKRLKEEIGNVFSSDEAGLNSDAKEAMAFACLGYLSVTGRGGNVISSTGAKYEAVLGQITLAKKVK